MKSRVTVLGVLGRLNTMVYFNSTEAIPNQARQTIAKLDSLGRGGSVHVGTENPVLLT